METKKSADELQQRVLKLGQQKLEEERLFQQIIQAVDRPPANRTDKTTKKQALSKDAAGHTPTSRRRA